MYYRGLTVTQFVCGSLYSMSCCLTAISFMSFALCNVLINCFYVL